MCHDTMEAPFHSDKRRSHTADAADEHIYIWVSSEIRQPAQNLNDAKGCAILRLILDRWMRSILLKVTIVDPDANVPRLKHLSRGPFLHGFIAEPQQSCPAQPAPVLPSGRGKTRRVLVLVLRCASQAQHFL